MSVLGINELDNLEQNIRCRIDDELLGILTRLNRTGELEDFLTMLGMQDLLNTESNYSHHPSGRIVVVGASKVKPNVLSAIGKELGISKERLEFYLDYEDGKKLDFRKYQWNPSYALILVGAMPHSGMCKGNAGSVIENLKQSDGYPPVVQIGKKELKITKSAFKEELTQMIDQGIIRRC